MSDPRVSVVLAVYNGLPHVREAIDSVLAQTFRDFELIVVDDASDDGTPDAVSSYDDPRVRLLRNERNLNQVVSLNRGIAEARGEYIARLDHDDLCAPTRLERQVALLDSRPDVGVVGSFVEIADLEGRRVSELSNTVSDFPDFVFTVLTERRLLVHPAATFRREDVLALGGYDESMRWAEDKDLWARLALARRHAAVVEEPLVVYRWHEGQQSNTSTSLQREAARRVQTRFCTELVGEEQAELVRLLFARDPRELWTEGDPASAGAALDAVVAGARSRLAFSTEEAARFEGLVRTHVRRRALQAWKAGPTAQRRFGRPLWGWAGGSAAVPTALAVAAPALHTLRRGRIRVTDAVHESPRTRRLKEAGRRFTRLTNLYRRIVSDR
ncbi:MAG: hypothetical protein QOE36_2581 [Gaiellaceae bacterium]|jgi:GT2 family glycosyltransferase|nr:hypothetical protein [Gaiellaceae bacterium]